MNEDFEDASDRLNLDKDTLNYLQPVFEKILKHALHWHSKVLTSEQKQRLRKMLEEKRNEKRSRDKDKRRPRKKRD